MAGATRQRILDAAEKLIFLKGLARVTTKEIAREIGLTEGALYRHFDHKEEIFFALMAKHLPAFYETFQAHQAGSGTPGENLVAIARAAVHYYEQIVPMGASFLADTELLVQFRATIQPLGIGPQSIFEHVAAYIEEEQQLGRMRQQIPALTLAILLLGPCFQWVFNRRFLGADPFHKTKQQFAEELVQGLSASFLPS
ncbi:MAG TPA: TetR/AcrR family transcriptional regulator [Ktedonobacteraceae bacterium]|nr:TetR/AcrR family transcriptional regulator [Ktedonobacteraceae bacterium]